MVHFVSLPAWQACSSLPSNFQTTTASTPTHLVGQSHTLQVLVGVKPGRHGLGKVLQERLTVTAVCDVVTHLQGEGRGVYHL